MKKQEWIQAGVLVTTMFAIGTGFYFIGNSNSENDVASPKITETQEESAEVSNDYTTSESTTEVPDEEMSMIAGNVNGEMVFLLGKHWPTFTDNQKFHIVANRLHEISQIDFDGKIMEFQKSELEYVAILNRELTKPENQEKKISTIFNDVVLKTSVLKYPR